MIDKQTQPGPEDEQAWNKGCIHLAEARAMDRTRTPGAGVHSAYYAMHHAARAVLLKHDGESAATKHGAVIGRFGQIARNHSTDSAELMKLGRYINLVYQERIDADYDVEETTTADEADQCINQAEEFLSVCGRIFGFKPPK